MSDLWRDRYPDDVTCVRCLEVHPKEDLDRLLWCDECRALARHRAVRVGWVAGVVMALLLALWIWLVVRPDPELVLTGWIATVVAALWVGARVSREIVYGVQRYRNRRAVEAVPPELPVDGPEAEAEGSDGRSA